VAQRVERWIEVTPSQFTHEAEGLNIIRALLPRSSPFRAWSNLEFRDGHDKWHEVDLVVLGRRRLHLVELKDYSGTLRGDDLTWRRDGHRAEDSPLKLARRKAQRLAGKLQDELLRWAQETGARAVGQFHGVRPAEGEPIASVMLVLQRLKARAASPPPRALQTRRRPVPGVRLQPSAQSVFGDHSSAKVSIWRRTSSVAVGWASGG